MVKKAKNLRKICGYGSFPDAKIGNSIPNKVLEVVNNCYLSDDVSRVIPGMKDIKSFRKNGGERQRVSVRTFLNLSYIASTIDTFWEIKISLTKFREMRPPYCILAGGKGSHNVCVCKIHQNLRLRYAGIKQTLLKKHIQFDKSYRDSFNEMVCKESKSNCFLLNCQKCSLETVKETAANFLNILQRELPVVLKHDFIATAQSSFLNSLKATINEGEYIVTLDFSENYTFLIQDAIQSHHWNNSQATLHVYVAYFKQNNVLRNENFVVVSESLKHSAASVDLYNKKLIQYLKTKFSDSVIRNFFYFSDGAGSQYKNKFNLSSLLLHESEYGISAEWHFFATSHRKGACDGIGGCVKNAARIASLQKTNQITSPKDFYNWAVGYFKNISFDFCTNEEYKTHEKLYQSKDHDIERMNWPPLSPDMNPIEDVWSRMKLKMKERKGRMENLDELVNSIQEEWEAIPQKFLSNLV
ncbi:unnamed protein product [Brassicogethes aeneus]|uniref:Tc1-like transposase DDE domain-containing protein n=1 Tax=Brassicogethes aeneus TaxID=1431903 RepID=A0A9P0FIN6_BRAAE|nr:unnamed protein product [Brassicogethes aeneus]